MALFRFPVPALFTEAMSALPYRPEWEVETTLKTRYGDVVNLGYRDGDLFYVPRGMVTDIGKDCRAEGDIVELECKIPPKNELQEGILAKSWDLLSRGQSHILQGGTGIGKTYLALNLAARLKRRTLIVVTKDRMVQQWKDEITKFLGIPQEQIGHIQQKKCTCKDKAITVAMLHSLATDKYADWVKEYFGLVIFDECVVGSTKITLPNGQEDNMANLVRRVGNGEMVSVMACDTDTGRIRARSVLDAWKVGTRKVVKITLDDGRTLRCTHEHPIYTTNRGFVYAKDLTPDDDVKVL